MATLKLVGTDQADSILKFLQPGDTFIGLPTQIIRLSLTTISALTANTTVINLTAPAKIQVTSAVISVKNVTGTV
jgi:hypothetical protein